MKRLGISKIIAVLEEHGPMTAEKIAEKLDVTETTIHGHINTFRRQFKGVRIAGYDKASPTRKARLYGLGMAPDVAYPNPRRAPSVLKKIKYPGMTREEVAEMRHQKEMLRQIKPFRDPMLFMTAGRPA